MKRIDKENYYLDIAETVAERATCLRRCYGAIIVRNDEIIATGYNGAPRGRRNCVDLNYCTREALNIPSGERYELCRSVHAEANAIISAARSETLGATLYMACKNPATGELIAGSTSCAMCRRLIINAGIQRVVIRNTKTDYSNIPSGERYELCRSVHAEANAIISAARSETLGATLYMACKNPATGELIAGSTSCAMCRRLIINAGIQRVVIRNTKTDYSVVESIVFMRIIEN